LLFSASSGIDALFSTTSADSVPMTSFPFAAGSDVANAFVFTSNDPHQAANVRNESNPNIRNLRVQLNVRKQLLFSFITE
jgi:hypothetical protein